MKTKALCRSILITGLLAAAFSTTSATAQTDKTLHLYNWADYIDPSLLEKFTAETGIKIVYDTFDTNEFLLTKMLSGKTGYDLVVPGTPFLVKMIEAGVVQPLDKSKLTHLDQTWDVINARIQEFPQAADYSVNWMWGTTGIAYNVKAFEERMPKGTEANTLSMIFNPEIVAKFADCGVYILDTADEVIPAALTYAGLNPNSTDKNDLAKAEEILLAIRPYVKKFHSSEQINALAGGDACLSLGWSGDVMMAKSRAIEAKNNIQIEFAIPKEGALIWMDQFAIPKDAPHVDNAYTFLNFIMQPENNAKAQTYLTYASGNKGSQQYLPQELLANKALFPDSATMQKLYTKQPYAQRDQKAVTRLWTKVKSGK